MSDGTSIFSMISGIGDSFRKSYEGSRKEALASDLGAKLKAGDYAGAADVALQGGDVQTGLALVKLGESRGASKQLSDTLGGLFGGGETAAPDGSGDGTMRFGDLGTRRSGGGSSLPSFAGGQAPMRVPGSGGEIESRFIGALKANGLTNPIGLAAMAAYAGHESGYKGSNIAGSWSDPSESGQPGTSGGILSWRGDRFANMRRMTAGAEDPVVAQAKFAIVENPDLTLALQNAKSPEEANRLMADAWKFAGYNRTGGEAAARLNSTRAYLARLGGGGGDGPTPSSPGTAVAEADMPAADAQQTDFVIPPAQSGGALTRIGTPAGGQGGAPRLGLPSQSNTTGPGATGVGGGTAAGAGAQDGDAAAPSAGATPANPTLPDFRVAGELKRAGLPNQVALTAQRATAGSPERVSALVRASLIPGLSEQQQGVVKTLLAHELQSTTQLTSDQKEYAVGLTQGFKGTLQEWKAAQRPDRTKFVTGPDGQQYAVDPNDLGAAPRSLNLPGAVRVWGQAGPDGQIVQPPPGVPAGAAGYYDARGVPQLVTGKGVNVTNNVGAGETEEAKELGKLRGKRAETIEAAAMKAPDQIAKLNLLDGVLARATTGTLGPAESTVVGLAQSLGIPNATIANLGLNPDQAVTAQVATKLTNELVTGMIGGGGFPANNFSNSDREFLTDIFPKMSNRPEANRLAIQVLQRVQQRNLEFGDAWAEYQQEREAAGKPVRVAEFEFNYRKSLRGKPDLFADIRQQVNDLPRAGGGSAAGGGAGASGGSGTGTPGGPVPAFSPSSTRISMPDAQALKAAPDTPENRQVFDQRYGEGAAQFVLKKPAPEGAPQPGTSAASAQPKTIARGSSRQPMPPGVTTGQLISEARSALADGRQRSVIEDRLRAYGIDPKRLEN